MNFKEIEQSVKDKIQSELELEASYILMSRLKELTEAKRKVSLLEKSYNELLEKDVEDIVTIKNKGIADCKYLDLVVGEGLKL